MLKSKLRGVGQGGCMIPSQLVPPTFSSEKTHPSRTSPLSLSLLSDPNRTAIAPRNPVVIQRHPAPAQWAWVNQTSLGDQELFTDPLFQLHLWASQAVLVVKNPPANAGDLSQEDPLEEEMATHSSILAWRIPWTEEPGGLQSIRSQRVGHD